MRVFSTTIFLHAQVPLKLKMTRSCLFSLIEQRASFLAR